MLLEICANSYQSAKNAHDANAHRIELCQELSIGGLTPSVGLVKSVIENLSIKTFILIRPRSGNFTYSDREFETMKEDIKAYKKIGCQGIVSGVLKSDHTIDIERTAELLKLTRPLDFTFHRAFDCVPNPTHALEQLINLGVERVLTSGQASSAKEGLELLKQLNRQANGRITLLPGSGVNIKNIKLFKDIGFEEIHTSASHIIDTKMEPCRFDIERTESSTEIIRSLLKTIQEDV